MESPRILVVEDEWIVAEDIRTSLNNLGYDVTSVAASGEEAIQKAEEEAPDLVLMDIVLQGEMDGIEAAGRISSSFDIPVIYLTAYSNPQLLEQAKQTGPFGYMIKPFREKGLHTAIEMALFKHKTELELRDRLQQEVTSRRRVELVVETFLEEKELLLEEIHQGVRNSTQLMFGLLDIHARGVKGRARELIDIHSGYVKAKPQLDVFRECQNRVMAMVLAQEQVYRSTHPLEVDLRGYIEELTGNLYRSYGVDEDDISLEIDVGDVRFGVDTAIPCGLIVNEIVSNSLQHAFPEERAGKLTIALVSVAENEFELIVGDNGIGLPADIDLEALQTLGLTMLVAFADGELQGRIELDRAEGTEFRIRFEARPRRRGQRRAS